MPGDMDGQDGSFGSFGNFQKPPVPWPVFDPLETEPADLACWKYDYRLFTGEGLYYPFDVFFSACSSHILHG